MCLLILVAANIFHITLATKCRLWSWRQRSPQWLPDKIQVSGRHAALSKWVLHKILHYDFQQNLMRKFVGPLDLFGAVGPNGHAVHVHWFLACNEVSHVELDATFLRMGNLDALGTPGGFSLQAAPSEIEAEKNSRPSPFIFSFGHVPPTPNLIMKFTDARSRSWSWIVFPPISATKTQHGIESQLMGHGGLGFFSECPSATIPFIGEIWGIQTTNPNHPKPTFNH